MCKIVPVLDPTHIISKNNYYLSTYEIIDDGYAVTHNLKDEWTEDGEVWTRLVRFSYKYVGCNLTEYDPHVVAWKGSNPRIFRMVPRLCD